MTHSFYDGTITVTQAIMSTLSHTLHEAEKQPKASTILDARLIEDMFSIPAQIKLACQTSGNIAARLTGREAIELEGKPPTFAECFEWIDAVLKTLKEADKHVVDEQADMVAPTLAGPRHRVGPGPTTPIPAATYVHMVALPNLYFHFITTYSVLRKEGVPIGKRNYYVGFFGEDSLKVQ